MKEYVQTLQLLQDKVLQCSFSTWQYNSFKITFRKFKGVTEYELLRLPMPNNTYSYSIITTNKQGVKERVFSDFDLFWGAAYNIIHK